MAGISEAARVALVDKRLGFRSIDCDGPTQERALPMVEVSCDRYPFVANMALPLSRCVGRAREPKSPGSG